MSDLSTYRDDVRKLSRQAFMRTYAHPFLLLKVEGEASKSAQPPSSAPTIVLPEGEIAEANDDWANHTKVSITLPKTGSFAVLRHNAELFRIYALLPKVMPQTEAIAAPSAAEYAGVETKALELDITVGRAADNDIVLLDNPVSKHHARFELRAGVDAFLTDLGSRNGTSVGGRRLQPNARCEVSFGDAIVLGGLAVSLIGAGALWEIIRQQIA